MSTYRLKNIEVQAILFTGQKLDDLPEWVRNYQAYSSMSGTSGVAPTLNGIIIPTQNGCTTCNIGDVLIWDGKVLTAMASKKFSETYDELV